LLADLQVPDETSVLKGAAVGPGVQDGRLAVWDGVDAYLQGVDAVGPEQADASIEAFGRKHLQGLRPNEIEVPEREWSGLADDQVIEQASAGMLLRDPEYAEWLVLLGLGVSLLLRLLR
jgi:hypothetical protein